MKKWICLFFCCCILCGCSAGHGSFKEGDMEMAYLRDKITDRVAKGKWNMGMLKDEPLSPKEVETCFHLDMTQIEDSFVLQGLISAQLSEVAIFKVDKAGEAMLKKGIQQHLQDVKTTWGKDIADASSLLSNHMEGRHGQYYYFVLGEDAEKVVHYMQEL